MEDINVINQKLDILLAGQAVLYRKIEKMQDKMDGKTKSASDLSYFNDYLKEAEKMLENIRENDNPEVSPILGLLM